MALEINFKGLSTQQVKEKLVQYGTNSIFKTSDIKFLDIVFEEITEPVILLLFVVGILYSLWGNIDDAITIILIISALVFVEVSNEYRAKKAISSLSKIAALKTKVIRDGVSQEIETENVVPGDIIVLMPGTRVAADARIVRNLNLMADESGLTGESLEIDKHLNDEIYAGTTITYGQGLAKVFNTGINTKFGKISENLKIIKPPKTKLQLEMKALAGKLLWFAVGISILIPILGYFRGQDLKTMILTGLALSFAVIPEELPMVITMVLGLGSYSLSKNNFFVKKIKAAETLGTVSVIVTDKTGTLTSGIMKPVYFYPEQEKIIETVSATLTSFSDSTLDKAMIELARELNISNPAEVISQRLMGKNSKTISCVIKRGTNYALIVRGAPEEVLSKSKKVDIEIKDLIDSETAKGRRLIGIASKNIRQDDLSKPLIELEKGMKFEGIIGFEDSPRPNVKQAITQVLKAGIRTIMVTGDHPQTAKFIGNLVGIKSEKVITGTELANMTDEDLSKELKKVSIFARANPEDKLRIVQLLQSSGEVVGVTGDGINDSLALKTADIGIAMGLKGTDVAKEASEIVLADDNYITITQGIFEGRKLFDNLKKGVKYYLSVKFALILIFLLPAILGVISPLAPIQIIVLELFMDLAASAGFVAEPIEEDVYGKFNKQISEGVLGKKAVIDILVKGLALFGAVSGVYFYSLTKLPLKEAQSLAFATWIFTHVFLAYVSRSDRQSNFKIGIFKKKIINIWGFGAISLFLIGINSSFLQDKLNLTGVASENIIYVALISLIVSLATEFIKPKINSL